MAFDTAHAPLPTSTSDPSSSLVSSSCFEFLLIELVPLAYRLTGEQAARDTAADANGAWTLDRPAKSSGNAMGQNSGVSSAQKQLHQRAGSTMTGITGLGIGGIGGAVDGMDEEETREAVFWRLDSLGYRVGLGIVDR